MSTDAAATVIPTTARPAFLDGEAKRHLIGGQWVAPVSGETIPSVDPSTGEVIAEIAAGSAEDVDRAVQAARAAFRGPWSRYTPVQRQQVLLDLADLVDRHYEELHLLDVLDMGRPVGATPRTASGFCLDTIRHYAALAVTTHGQNIDNSTGNRLTYTRREPLGVVGAIIPWNGPLESTLWKLAPVLASGCTVVLKPAEEASLSALRLADLMRELDLPPGVVNVVTGYGEAAGAALSAHPDVDKIAFTGSTEVGRAIVRAAAGNLKRVSLELGGKSPNIVFADSDLEVAAKGAAAAIFANTGQVCLAGSRLFAEASIADELAARVAAHADALRVGNSLDPATEIGPLVSARQLERVSGYLDIGRDEGAVLTTGGGRLTRDGLGDGFFVAPTVFTGVEDSMRIATEEIFGPVVTVLPFTDLDEVVERANHTPYGLGAGVWTRDVAKAHKVAHAIESGVVWVNTYGDFDPAVPFGGYKASGWGRELGEHSMDDYLNTKAVWVALDV